MDNDFLKFDTLRRAVEQLSGNNVLPLDPDQVWLICYVCAGDNLSPCEHLLEIAEKGVAGLTDVFKQ